MFRGISGHDCDNTLSALLAQLDSTNERAALVHQSIALMRDLEAPLLRLLELTPGAGANMSLLDAVPELTLKFYPLNVQRSWAIADIPSILRAFAVLACHSQRISSFPELKTAFWLRVLQSKMAHEVTRDVHKSAFRHPAFPAFVVDFGGSPRASWRDEVVPEGGSHGSFTFTEAVGDALFAFMTSPPSLLGPASASTTQVFPATRSTLSTPRASTLAFGFKFDSCDLRFTSLALIERFFDRTFASADREFDVRMLSFSKHYMLPEDLAALARIVQKSVRVYGVEELQMVEIMPGIVGGPRPDWQCPDATPSEYMDIARAVFELDALSVLASRKLQATAVPPAGSDVPPSRLRKVCMTGNYVCTELFAARFSALRYGSSLTDDTTVYVSMNHRGLEHYLDYWRWLAFGLFYPRPKRFAARLRLRNIGHVQHSPDIVKTLIKTLRNPASELVYNGKNESGGDDIATTTELMVCIVKAGASVDVFKTGSATKPTWTDTLVEESELEAICEKPDGSVCVVIPGVGLGWVRAEFVERIEREPLSSNRSEHDGLYDTDIGLRFQWRTNMNGQYSERELNSSMRTMVETLGRQFRSLSFGHNYFERGFLQVMLEHCTKLERLSLENSNISVHGGQYLLDALSGALGDRLLSLNLNYNDKLGNPFLTRLFSILGDVDNPPALREVRLRFCKLSTKHVEALHDVLRLNTKLTVIEFFSKSDSFSHGQKKEVASLDTAFQGQLLQSTLSRESKLAFLSVVVSGTSGSKPSAVRSLDSWLLSSIFAFAADREVRRTLAWDEEIWCGRY